MGKQSKRRVPKKKQERHELLQERRERQIADPSDYDVDDDDDDDEIFTLYQKEPYYVGERVWVRDRERDTVEEPVYVRGMVIASTEQAWNKNNPTPMTIEVIPLDKDPNNKNDVWTVTVGPSTFPGYPRRLDILPDPYPLVTRFASGDRVLCSVNEGWAPATVMDVFPD